MEEANRVTAYLKVTAEFYDPEATPETVRYAVEQTLEDSGFDVEVVNLSKPIKIAYEGPIGIYTDLGEKENDNHSGWIPVSDRLPPEHDTIFAKLKGTDKWRDAMFAKASDDVRVVFRFEDGTRKVGHNHTIDGVWDCEKPNRYPNRTVTHWCENPTLPEEE